MTDIKKKHIGGVGTKERDEKWAGTAKEEFLNGKFGEGNIIGKEGKVAGGGALTRRDSREYICSWTIKSSWGQGQKWAMGNISVVHTSSVIHVMMFCTQFSMWGESRFLK